MIYGFCFVHCQRNFHFIAKKKIFHKKKYCFVQEISIFIAKKIIFFQQNTTTSKN